MRRFLERSAPEPAGLLQGLSSPADESPSWNGEKALLVRAGSELREWFGRILNSDEDAGAIQPMEFEDRLVCADR
jgi:hypothetical protein